MALKITELRHGSIILSPQKEPCIVQCIRASQVCLVKNTDRSIAQVLTLQKLAWPVTIDAELSQCFAIPLTRELVAKMGFNKTDPNVYEMNLGTWSNYKVCFSDNENVVARLIIYANRHNSKYIDVSCPSVHILQNIMLSTSGVEPVVFPKAFL